MSANVLGVRVTSVGSSKPSTSATGCGIVFLVATVLGAVVWLFQTHPAVFGTVLFCAIAIPIGIAAVRARRARDEEVRAMMESQQQWDSLCANFGADGANAILARRLWIGAPTTAVVAMLGPPLSVQRLDGPDGPREIYGYAPQGYDFGLTIEIVDAVVRSWNDRVGALG